MVKPPVALAAAAVENHNLRELERVLGIYNWIVHERLDVKARGIMTPYCASAWSLAL